MSDEARHRRPREVRLGIRANAAQFWLLVGINGFVGAMVGIERSTLSLLGSRVFSVESATALASFLVAFGIAKAAANFAAGALADRHDRRRTLLAGWLFALPVPALIAFAPTWGWIVFANVLLGISQGLAWSSTIIMKVDLAGPRRRGLAMGLNETAGYASVSLAAFAAGVVAGHVGLRDALVWLGAGIALTGFVASALLARDTTAHAQLEQRDHHDDDTPSLTTSQVIAATSWRDPTLATSSHVGLVNNLNDGLAWAVFPLWFASHGASVGRVGLLTAIYPFVWGVGQLGAGWASDHVDRRLMVWAGMALQATGIALVAAIPSMLAWVPGLVALGLGTALVYPTLLAVVSDASVPQWRARALGVYRMWRDLGYVAGALLTGVVADVAGMRAAILAVAGLTLAAAVLARLRMPAVTRSAAVPQG